MAKGRPPSVNPEEIRRYRKEQLAEVTRLDLDIERLQELRKTTREQASIKHIARMFNISPSHAETILNNRPRTRK